MSIEVFPEVHEERDLSGTDIKGSSNSTYLEHGRLGSFSPESPLAPWFLEDMRLGSPSALSPTSLPILNAGSLTEPALQAAKRLPGKRC